MNYKFLVAFMFLFISIIGTGQNQEELFHFGYRYTAQAPINNETHQVLNEVNYANRFLNLSINYGHSFKDTTLFMVYSLMINNVSQNIGLSNVSDNDLLGILPNKYYEYPQFSQLSFSTGISKKLMNNWALTGIMTANVVDDFFRSELPVSVNFQGLCYVEKEHDKNLSYGIGMFLGQTENRLVPFPVVSFNYQGEKRGIESLFPSNIRIWQMINKVAYLEISTYSNFYSLRYESSNPVVSMDVISIIPEFTYNHVWDDFLKFEIGIDFPLNDVIITGKDEMFTYNQFSIGFKFGVSLVID